MKKLWYATLLLLFTAASAPAAQPEYLWTRFIEEADIQYVADAELTPDGDVLILGWEDDFQFYVAKYSLEGKQCWKLDCPTFADMHDILPITDPQGTIVIYGGGKDDARYFCFLKVSPDGSALDELPFARDSGYGRTSLMMTDSLKTACIPGIDLRRPATLKPRFKCVDWNHNVCWSYEYPDIRSRIYRDDVILFGDDKLVLADMWCYNDKGVAVSCPKGVRSDVTFTIVTREPYRENTHEYDFPFSASISKLFRVSDGYLLTGYPEPKNDISYDAPAFVVKFNTNGDTLWSGVYPKEANYNSNLGALDLIETDDGRYYLLLKYHGPTGGDTAFLMIEISATGAELSIERYGGGDFIPHRLLRLSDHEMRIVGNITKNTRLPRTFLMCFGY
ncbi:hypothetical protein KKC97_13090 [bacterium]|nr:hypothetical protein [bacterium]